MANTDPNIIGIAIRCMGCGWCFRCPVAQQYRVMCTACKSRCR